MRALDGISRWLERHQALAYPALGAAVFLAVAWAVWSRWSQPSFSPDELWQLKRKTLYLLEDDHRGLSAGAAASKLSVSARHMKRVFEDLVQDRFVVAEREGGQTIFKLKRLQGGSLH